MFSKALAKAPDDRYHSCVEFADALRAQLQSVSAETGATDATAVALAASRPRLESRSRQAVSDPATANYWKIAVAVLAALLLAVIVTAVVLLALK